MNNQVSAPPYELVYCASDADGEFVVNMQKSLALLKSRGVIREWSYAQTAPGRSVSDATKSRMARADILAFLLSPDFLNSKECMEQWEYAGQLTKSNPQILRVPIIIRECPWPDLFVDEDPMPLPKDGRSISNFEDADTAWLHVYEGIKQIVEDLRSHFMPQEGFVSSINELDIPSMRNVDLRDLFVFPNVRDEKIPERGERFNAYAIHSTAELLATKHVIIHGPDQSGKTALARYLYLDLIGNNEPVLLITNPNARRIDASFFKREYRNQYNGDYALWEQQDGKTLIIDGIHPGQRGSDLLDSARKVFEKLVLVIPSDLYYSMYFDDVNVGDFRAFAIQPLTMNQQEQLIRKRVVLKTGDDRVADGYVDQIEQRVNHIIVSNKIVPRYPFFVLSILESFESFMPGSVPITSFGHCYYALIVSRLVHAGINSDDAIDSCFNFLEELAYATYVSKSHEATDELDLSAFVVQYREDFIIRDALLNRLKHSEFGVIDTNGAFRTDYIYYFILGKYLANSQKIKYDVIERLCENSHTEDNFLTILFTIHHTNDNWIIDDILLRTMVTLDDVKPAQLSKVETATFERILSALPESILSDEPVANVRALARDAHDQLSEIEIADDVPMPEEERFAPVTNMLRIFRNGKIMGQVLRTKHGSLNIKKLNEIVETIAEAGLRLITLSLLDEQQINRMKERVRSQIKDIDPHIEDVDDEQLAMITEYSTLMWILINLQQIVNCINVPEIDDIVKNIVKKKIA